MSLYPIGINCGTFRTTACSQCIFHNSEYRPDKCGGDCYLDPKIAACKETAAPDSEGWILVQRRGQFGNNQDYFAKTFAEYQDGFGPVVYEIQKAISHTFTVGYILI